MYFAGFPYILLILVWVLHEVLFRFFGNLVVELFATYVYFLCNLFVVVKTLSTYYKSDVFQFTQTKPKQKKKKTEEANDIYIDMMGTKTLSNSL